MPARTCIVSFTDPEGMRHAVEVTAASLFEAAARALREFRSSSLPDASKPGIATRLLVSVKTPGTKHEVTVQRLERWLEGGARSPKEAALKANLRAVLAAKPVAALLARDDTAETPTLPVIRTLRYAPTYGRY